MKTQIVTMIVLFSMVGLNAYAKDRAGKAEGIYSAKTAVAVQVGDGQEPEVMEDLNSAVLQKINKKTISFALEFVFTNGHMCSMEGQAKYSKKDKGFVYQESLRDYFSDDATATVECKLVIEHIPGKSREQDKVSFKDINQVCRTEYCGYNASLSDIELNRSHDMSIAE